MRGRPAPRQQDLARREVDTGPRGPASRRAPRRPFGASADEASRAAPATGPRILDVVDADHPHVARNGIPETQQRLHQLRRGPVVGADDGIGPAALCSSRTARASPGSSRVASAVACGPRGRALPDTRPRARRRSPPPPAARRTRPAGAEPQQVVGDDVPGAAVVDADQVVSAALRVRQQSRSSSTTGMRAASSARTIRRLTHPGGGELEWREEHAGNPPLEVLLAQLPGLLRLSIAGPSDAAPHSACSRASGDAIIPWHIGSRSRSRRDRGSASRTTGRRRRADGRDVGPGSRAPLDEAGQLKIADSAPNGDARRAETEGRVRPRSAADRPASSGPLNLVLERGVDLTVLGLRPGARYRHGVNVISTLRRSARHRTVEFG